MRMLGCLAGRDNRVRTALRLAAGALLAMFAVPQTAWACEQESDVLYYFHREPPAFTPDIMFVRVTIVSKTWESVEARLEGGFAKLSLDGMIHIELPSPPQGTNCIAWGELEGPVYIVASSALVQNGRASIIARPTRPTEDVRDHRGHGVMRDLRRDATIWIDPSIYPSSNEQPSRNQDPAPEGRRNPQGHP